MPKSIPLTRNKCAIIDDDDYDRIISSGYHWVAINNHNLWYAMGYRRINRKADSVLMHRLIMGALDGQILDHKDGNGLNNSKSNLRIATYTENMGNQNKHKNNRSGYKGVTFHKSHGRFEAQIYKNHERYFLGYYDDPRDGAIAYNNAAQKLYGEFARLNAI